MAKSASDHLQEVVESTTETTEAVKHAEAKASYESERIISHLQRVEQAIRNFQGLMLFLLVGLPIIAVLGYFAIALVAITTKGLPS